MSGMLLIAALALLGAWLIAAAPTSPNTPSIEAILAKLPQTQCGQCGYAGCRPYAAAIACGEADIDLCPPGGDATVAALARLTGTPPQTLPAKYGAPPPQQVAYIDAVRCIGCVKCIKACPTDAILGAALCMHTVLAGECTGCGLCIEPCPVDCISLRAG